MKMSKSVSLDIDVAERIEKESKKFGNSFSEIVNFILKQHFKKNQLPEIITCNKCGCEYSERIPTCPACENEKAKEKRREMTEKELEKAKAEQAKTAEKIQEEIDIDLIKLDLLSERVEAMEAKEELDTKETGALERLRDDKNNLELEIQKKKDRIEDLNAQEKAEELLEKS